MIQQHINPATSRTSHLCYKPHHLLVYFSSYICFFCFVFLSLIYKCPLCFMLDIIIITKYNILLVLFFLLHNRRIFQKVRFIAYLVN